MINTLWLKTFCTLVDVGHFTHTADKLFMTQSGVSQHIKKLEQLLDTDLLLRTGKSFRLTPAGLKLYEDGKEILLALQNAEQAIKEDDPHQGTITMMSPGSLGLKLYPFLLDKQQQFKQLVINYSFASNKGIITSLLAGDSDLGLVTSQVANNDLIFAEIAQEPLVLVAPATQKDIDWPQLLKLGFISHPDADHHGSMLLSANYPEFEHISQLNQSGFSNQISMILEPVSRGLGFTVLPLHAAMAFAAQSMISIHTLPNAVNEPIYICRKKYSPLLKRQQLVIDWISEQLAL
ncbi:LysR family transcriptional regulator [Thalassotalea sp. HSM 43]|uniref:LysR family transcriptional regulator n=1 Tax=Thalassotalea sp. HSM 43 TaxID=2552945 RepID=UPI001081B81A|nr:LysR family transcriptional regulator [Thalassotalea sp. HSM 43]QBY04704.1 LysR family transcriptional regulator [Thalassotalea sp. HSM 43]